MQRAEKKVTRARVDAAPDAATRPRHQPVRGTERATRSDRPSDIRVVPPSLVPPSLASPSCRSSARRTVEPPSRSTAEPQSRMRGCRDDVGRIGWLSGDVSPLDHTPSAQAAGAHTTGGCVRAGSSRQGGGRVCGYVRACGPWSRAVACGVCRRAQSVGIICSRPPAASLPDMRTDATIRVRRHRRERGRDREYEVHRPQPLHRTARHRAALSARRRRRCGRARPPRRGHRPAEGRTRHRPYCHRTVLCLVPPVQLSRQTTAF